MALLNSDDLSFDFRYTDFIDDWVEYQFFFRWRGESIVRDEVLKSWSGKLKGAFFANEYESDGLIPLIKKVLDSDEADYWEALEPDITVAIYPNAFFPFLETKRELIYESEEAKRIREEREELKREKGKLPDDMFTFIVFVDAMNFKGSDAYYGQGISLNMCVYRYQLEEFLKDLEFEYAEFKKSFKVDEYIED